MSWEKFAKNISIILVEPEHPGNIGSVARAMKNMGLRKLILVSPIDYSKETYWLAHASEEILEEAIILKNFSEILNEVDIIFATSNRKRDRKPPKSIREISSTILEKAGELRIGIVFGRENKGLFNEEINLAEDLIIIPSFTDYPSLNLSQAVMITCYELFQASFSDYQTKKRDYATVGEKEYLSEHFHKTLGVIEYKPTQYEREWARMKNLFRDFLNISEVDKKSIRFLHKYFAEIERFVKYRLPNQKSEAKKKP